MGKIQCVSSHRNSHNWEFIEKSLDNANSPLEKKIKAEYLHLKNSLDQERKHLTFGKNKITQKNKRKLSSFISNRKKFERFLKWFKMSFSDLFAKSDDNGMISKELDMNKIDGKNVNFPNNYNKLPNSNYLNNNINNNNVLFDLSEIANSNNSPKFCHNDIIDKYFLSNNGISSIEYLENDLARDNESESENSLNVNNLGHNINIARLNPLGNIIQNQNDFLPLYYFQDRNEMVLTLIETNILKFYNNHRVRFLGRVLKGPPESFRWLAWMICGEIPIDRKNEFFMQNYLEKLDDKTDNQIKKDLNRTMVDISLMKYTSTQSIDRIFNEDPTCNYLYRVLRAFSNNDKEVSYCQGMNFIAGFILVASDFNEIDTFYMLIALFSETFGSKFGIRGFFSENFPLLKAYIFVFNYFFEKKMPEVKEHFERLEIPDEVWISKWIQTLYTICLPIDATMRVWDCMMSHGLEFLISFSIALVKQFESDLLKLADSFEVIEFFRHIFTGDIDMGSNNDANKSNTPHKNKNPESNLNRSYANNHLNHINTMENQSNIQTINLEEILHNAKKLKINKQTVNLIKKEYESKFQIDLSYLNKKYDMSIALSGQSAVSMSGSNSLSAKVSENQESNYTSRSQNIPKSNVPVHTQIMNEKSTGLTNGSQSNNAKENSENINVNHEPLQIQSINDDEDDCAVVDTSLDSVSEANLHIQIESHCFKAKSSII